MAESRSRIPVISSVTAQPFDGDRSLIVEALVKPVRWREAVQAMSREGVDLFVETGPGRVLTGLALRAVPEARAVTLDELAFDRTKSMPPGTRPGANDGLRSYPR